MSFHLFIQTPEREVYKGDADILSLSNDTGEMQVFPGHASMLGSITYSAIKVDHAQHEEAFVLRQGFIFVDQDKNEVKVLGLSCEKTEELDMVSAKEYLEFVLSKLDNPEELNEYQLKFLEGQKLAVEKQLHH